jgi:large subunit ribosomal protein L1
MPKISKRMKAIRVNIPKKPHSLSDAIANLKDNSKVKFKESVDVSIMLGVDPRKSDQVVRGATLMPKGTGKTVRVAVFAQGDDADKAKAAGADIVGFDDLADQIKAGEMNFDLVIATPAAMRVVGQLGQILGPRGLMPNPKVGTVTPNVVKAIENAKAGQVRYRTDKNGIIHCSIGKVDFNAGDLQENLVALISDLKKAKPSNAKGMYLKKISISTTMGPGITIDQSSIEM